MQKEAAAHSRWPPDPHATILGFRFFAFPPEEDDGLGSPSVAQPGTPERSPGRYCHVKVGAALVVGHDPLRCTASFKKGSPLTAAGPFSYVPARPVSFSPCGICLAAPTEFPQAGGALPLCPPSR